MSDLCLEDEGGRGRAPEHAEERGMLRSFPADVLPVDLAYHPDDRPLGPLANDTSAGDGLIAGPLDTTAQTHER